MLRSSIPRFTDRTDVFSWGRVRREPQRLAHPTFADQLSGLAVDATRPSRLATGLRRSYGDSCLNGPGLLIDMTGVDRFISFDRDTGRLVAEAGISLSHILQVVVPQGWFLPTTPGTRFVTLGGAVANDVHGKNHHRFGSMGCSVRSLGLISGDGARLTIGPNDRPDLFAATIGGLGLTGVIEWVELQLVRVGSAYLDVETIPYDNLGAFWALADESTVSHEHTVAWIDCMSRGARTGRGVFTRANWASDGAYTIHSDRTWKSMPLELPGFALNRLSVAAFNEFYFRLHKMKPRHQRQHYATYFYPLDAVLNWNRLYGRRGMMQYQCVVPPGSDRAVMGVLLDEISRSGQASFLAVLKTFGDVASPGLLSFPRPGATLALDFPNRGVETLALMARLDRIVADAGGALYPAKDGRMPADMFRRSFPDWQRFAGLKDPKMNSDFWRRVSLDD
ncbi:FAD-dependent oxidoreductase [Pleomorphomonas sp. PLEO]|uniref:FAD-binding oxidoreductase n=1 Tax=Pleomorphomonas sp. PLEO TaxID=3239306 RepID=UPI00351E83B1